MYARLVQSLPQGQEWLYGVKFDGYRCLAGKDSTGVTLWSRSTKPFHKANPRKSLVPVNGSRPIHSLMGIHGLSPLPQWVCRKKEIIKLKSHSSDERRQGSVSFLLPGSSKFDSVERRDKLTSLGTSCAAGDSMQPGESLRELKLYG
jgi:hypothetical protein